MRIAATGHRQPRLGLKYTSEDNKLLTMFAKWALEESREGYDSLTVISGMATGWDQAVAHAAILLNIPIIAALPFRGQEAMWPASGRERYHAILKRAQEVVVVSEGGYDNSKFFKRDEWMVEHSDAVLALWDGAADGGTYLTVRYAEGLGIPVVNVWQQFESYCWKERHGGKQVGQNAV